MSNTSEKVTVTIEMEAAKLEELKQRAAEQYRTLDEQFEYELWKGIENVKLKQAGIDVGDNPTGRYWMNTATGSVDTYNGWWYENEDGEQVNAVDEGRVVEVIPDGDGWWKELE